MSRELARTALDQMAGRPSLIASRYAQNPQTSESAAAGGLFADLRDLAAADATAEAARFEERKATLVAAYGYSDGGQDRKPFAFADGKAIVPIHGILINRFSSSWSFATGYNFIRNQLSSAMADEDVDGIIFDVNSYGGTVAGCPETADLIARCNAKNGGKPIISVIDANCFSAAYYLVSQSDHIAITSSGETGSIGVVQMHVDVSDMLDQAGIKVTFQYAGDHKVDGSPFAPLSAKAKKDRQAKIDASMNAFVSTVAEGRGLPEQDVRDTQARCVSAEEALSLGLVDAISTPDDAVASFFDGEDDELNDDPEFSNRSDAMPAANTTNTPPAPVATGPTAAEIEAGNQAARTAERQRIAGITGHAEAKDRGALANHLALNTNMSIEEAGGVLAAAAKETPAPVAKVEETKVDDKKEGNHFQNAMNNGTQPNVGAGGSGGGEDGTEMTPAQRILSNQVRAGAVAKPRAA